jgi:hypothetical protein
MVNEYLNTDNGFINFQKDKSPATRQRHYSMGSIRAKMKRNTSQRTQRTVLRAAL